MGYIIEEKNIKADERVGMECDQCGLKTGLVDNSKWHGYYAQTYHYSENSTDYGWYTVCSPKCYFNHMKKLFKKVVNDNDGFEFDDTEYGFIKKMIEYV